MTTPAAGTGAPDVHQKVQEVAQLQTLLHTFFGSLGISVAGLEAEPGEDASQYFKLDPAEVREDMKLLQKVIDKAGSLLDRFRTILDDLNAPAGDDPSRKQVQATRDTIMAARQQLQNIVKYSTRYHKNLAISIGEYEEVDRANASRVTAAGQVSDHGSVI